MRCPSCNKELLYGGSHNYVTLLEHIDYGDNSYLRPVYYCGNKSCDCSQPEKSNTRIILSEITSVVDPNNIAIFWDDSGDLYGLGSDKIKFIKNNNAPFESISRKLRAEEEIKSDRIAFLDILFIKFFIIKTRECDEEGNVIKYGWKFEAWRRRNPIKEPNCYTLMIFWLSSWRMHYRWLKRSKNDFKTKKTSDSAKKFIDNLNYTSVFGKHSIKHHGLEGIIFSVFFKLFYFRILIEAIEIRGDDTNE